MIIWQLFITAMLERAIMLERIESLREMDVDCVYPSDHGFSTFFFIHWLILHFFVTNCYLITLISKFWRILICQNIVLSNQIRRALTLTHVQNFNPLFRKIYPSQNVHRYRKNISSTKRMFNEYFPLPKSHKNSVIQAPELIKPH